MNSTSRPTVLSVALIAALGLAACGSDADSTAADPAEAAPETVAQEPAVEEASVDDTPDTAAEDVVDEDGEDHDGEDEGHDDEHGEDHDGEDEGHDDEHGEDHDDEEKDHDDEHDDEEKDHDDEHGDDEHDHDDESGELGAHEHGTAEVSVAWIGNEVAIDLISPNFNVFGFEYEPTSEEDLAIEADRTAAIAGPDVVAVNDEAACTLTDPASTEVERDGSHSEITVSWLFVCDNPGDISGLEFAGLFEEFPGFEDVDAQWISESEQSAAELSPSDTSLTLQG